MEELVYSLAEILARSFVRLLAPRRHMRWHLVVGKDVVQVSVDIEDEEPSVFESATAIPIYELTGDAR